MENPCPRLETVQRIKSIENVLPHQIGLIVLPLSSTSSANLNLQLHQVDYQKTMDCPKCHERLLCDYCCRYFKGDPVFKAPGCEKCRKRYEKEIDDAKTELANLRLSLRTKFAEQQSAYELAQSKLSERFAFLKLPDPDPSMEIFKGDVTFVVHGCDTILAHRFILAGKSSVFCRMFDCGMLENKTGLIPIDDASYPVMRAVIKYCYTADISFTDEVPPDEVLKVAHKYEITHLRDVCAEELCGRINEKNLAEMLRLSKSYEAKTLQEASAKYFKEHFDTVFSTVLENL
ncbi:hypothetical protein R1sor_017448 [Riccia sorocarpa]|uniref:BTB domain-containing protein n=1 Tax=Riccia sorocarpa TaxID=122646 RepID=A0ABD3I787_9MARC